MPLCILFTSILVFLSIQRYSVLFWRTFFFLFLIHPNTYYCLFKPKLLLSFSFILLLFVTRTHAIDCCLILLFISRIYSRFHICAVYRVWYMIVEWTRHGNWFKSILNVNKKKTIQSMTHSMLINFFLHLRLIIIHRNFDIYIEWGFFATV